MSKYISDGVLDFPSDFYTKIANDTIQCPLKIYEQDLANTSSIPAPTDSSWIENVSQLDIDKLKIQDNNPLVKITSEQGKTKTLMIECDYSNLCNILFANDNSAFKAKVSSASYIDLYAEAKGFNGNNNYNSITIKIWDGSIWNEIDEVDNTTIMQKQVYTFSNANITTNNKFYIILHSIFPAYNQILNSSISLDYININLKLNGIADVINPIPIVL